MKGNPITIKGKAHNDLTGTTFLTKEADGSQNRARIAKKLNDQRNASGDHSAFELTFDSQERKNDIMTHNDVMNHLHQDQLEDDGSTWKYQNVLGHQGPLTHGDPHCKGSKCNVEIEWENGEITFEPLGSIKEDDPITMAQCAKAQNPLDPDGWKSLKRFANREKKLQRLIRQAKLHSFRTAPKCQCGYQVPRNYKEALLLDKQNGNDMWASAVKLEMEQLDDYKTFINIRTCAPQSTPK